MGQDSRATITFMAPVNTGGSPIIDYRVTSTPGSITATGAVSPIDITGLTNGTEYTFTVSARNLVGQGPESLPSNAYVPGNVPDAPTGVTAS